MFDDKIGMYDDDEEGKSEEVCEVCGDTDEEMNTCRMCGVHFCPDCGYPENNLCFDCGDEVDEGLEDEADETFVESTEMD